MRLAHYILILFALAVPCLVGCGSSEPQAPSGDELTQFLDDNPDVAAEEENMGELGDE
jgi:hypothetical protein